MNEAIETLYQEAELAVAMRDVIELREIEQNLESALQDVPVEEANAIRARFEGFFADLGAASPVETAQTAESLYAAGRQAFAEQRHEDAVQLWEQAAERAPDHFELRRRLCVVQRALEQHEAADASLQLLLAIHARSPDPKIAALPMVLVDRFQLGDHLVTTHRRLAPPTDGVDYLWLFTLLADRTERLATVQLETSAYARERGTPFLLGMRTPGGHRSLPHSWSTLPPYLQLRTLAAGYLGKIPTPGT